MIPWVQLGAAEVPDGGGSLRLMQRRDEFSIMAGPIELMNSRLSGSEEAMARLAFDRLAHCKTPRILIGGLGLGFTLRAALQVFGPGAEITVGELVPEVVDWAHGPLSHIHGASLDDARVRLVVGDVRSLITTAPTAYDAVLLDVDNGPEGLTRRANDALYDLRGLNEAKAALTSKGVLAVWSSAPSAAFTRRLRAAGFGVEEVRVKAHRAKRGARHVIWLATKP